MLGRVGFRSGLMRWGRLDWVRLGYVRLVKVTFVAQEGARWGNLGVTQCVVQGLPRGCAL